MKLSKTLDEMRDVSTRIIESRDELDDPVRLATLTRQLLALFDFIGVDIDAPAPPTNWRRLS